MGAAIKPVNTARAEYTRHEATDLRMCPHGYHAGCMHPGGRSIQPN